MNVNVVEETSIATYLDRLTREMEMSEAEVMALAIKSGLRQLWREHILGNFLRGKISRDDAIAAVGLDWVKLAERQHEAVMEDLAWALEQ